MAESDKEQTGEIALAFVRALMGGDFDAAHALLSESLRSEWPPARLGETFATMIEYGDGPAEYLELVKVEDMLDWAIRENGDLGWAYVAIWGDGFHEGLSTIVALDGDRAAIRNLEWGRP